MALLGGGVGGAGNPVGGNFTGPAQALEIYGDHAQALSGIIISAASGTADSTMLNFTSGNYLFVGHISLQSDEVGTSTMYWRMEFNGTAVLRSNWDTSASNSPIMDMPIPIIIPAYTEVETLVGNSASSVEWTTQLVGRIYRE